MRLYSSRLTLTFALAIGLAFAAAPVRAQDSTAASPSTAATASPSTAAPVTAAPTSSGLPTEPAPPRTLRAYKHVWIAFTLAWLLLFGYVVSVGRRFGKVERELESLGG